MKPLTTVAALLMGVSSAHAQDALDITPRDISLNYVRPLEQRVHIVPRRSAVEPLPTPSDAASNTDMTEASDADEGEKSARAVTTPDVPPPSEEQDLATRELDHTHQPQTARPQPSESPVERYDRIAQTAIRAFDAEDYTTSVEILKTLREDMLAFGDVGMMVLLGYAAMHTDREQLSIDAMREAADLTEDNEFFQALIDVLLHFARYDDAERIVERMYPSPERDAVTARLVMANAERARESGNPEQAHALLQTNQALLSPAGLEALGWSSLERRQFEQAADSFEAAYRQAPSDDSARGLILSLHPLNRHARLLIITEETEGPLDLRLDDSTRRSIAAGHRHFLLNGDTALEPASAMVAGSVPGTAVRLEPRVRKRRGAPGEGRLSQQGVALQVHHNNRHNQLHVELEQQHADNDATQASGQRAYAVWQHRLENGVESRLGLGRSLSGGAVNPAPIGEVGIAYRQAEYGVGARLFRTDNDESLLALSGKHDSVSNTDWGHVLETGAQLDGYLNHDTWSLSGSLTLAELHGQRVADNRKIELYLQALRPVGTIEGLRVGPELYGSRFQHNLSAFEVGHGGYFSPDYYWRPGLQAAYNNSVTDQLALQATVGLGWGWSHQADADGNPLTGAEPDKYAATRESGATYQGRLQANWQFAPSWTAGMRLSGQRSPAYRDWQSALFIEHHLNHSADAKRLQADSASSRQIAAMGETRQETLALHQTPVTHGSPHTLSDPIETSTRHTSVQHVPAEQPQEHLTSIYTNLHDSFPPQRTLSTTEQPSTHVYFQVMALRSAASAHELQISLQQHLDGHVRVVRGDDGLFRAQVGTSRNPLDLRSQLDALGYHDAFQVR